jgi:hypothetical protein
MTLIVMVAASVLLGACVTPLPQTPPAGAAVSLSAPSVQAGSFWRHIVTDGFTRLPRGRVEQKVRRTACACTVRGGWPVNMS